ncbi:hypothetical protein AMJ85_03165 [candidate division BRC1 bacterium SM23_51]|nr:MAG: hypothetical protein AMJ85_03165 [candidate division BRC1 bacterium SM23_51]
MVKLTLGEKGQQFKHNLYWFGILLLVALVTCQVLRHVDWSYFRRTALEKQLRELEKDIVVESVQPELKTRKFMAKCNVWLRERWQTGYLYSEATGQGYFVGRLSAKFRNAVQAQKALIDAGKPFDEDRIPKLRLVVEFERINCRLLVADADYPVR